MCTSCGNASHVEAWFQPTNAFTTVTNSPVGASANAAAHPNPMLDGILWGGWRWTSAGSTTTTINYYLAGDNEFIQSDDGWSAIEHAALRNAFDSWEHVANLSFVQVFNAANATFIEHTASASSEVFNSPNQLGFHQTPESGAPVHGWYNWEGIGWHWDNPNGGLQIGGQGYTTIVHEIGHGIGLAHPHDNGGGSTIWPGVTGPFGSYGSNSLNQGVYTVMSYNGGWDAALNPDGQGLTTYGYNAGPSAFDIAAVQYLYGANNAWQTGNNTYVIPDVNAAGTYWTCIWDCGGSDAIVYGGNRATTISLVAATLDNSPTGGGVLTYANGIQGGFTIANGVIIENATGGFGSDLITGNGAGNRLWGRGGNDNIDGAGGIDSAVFSGLRSQYTFTALAGNGVRVTGPDGVDDLRNVERLIFDDMTLNWPLSGNWQVAGVVDFNNNGRTDILRYNDAGDVAVWLMNGATIDAAQMAGTGNGWRIDGVGNFDLDTNGDVLWRHSDGRVLIWEVSGTQVVSSQVVGSAGGAWEIAGTGDFNGDGRSDILWRSNLGEVSIWQMNGSQIQAAQLVNVAGSAWEIADVGDFNGDNRSDILWRGSAGEVSIWHMNGFQISSAQLVGVAGSTWRIDGTGDFDGDNRSDILWRGNGGEVSVWEMNGFQIQSAQLVGNAASSWQIVDTGNFNGDTFDDILWQGTGGEESIWTMNNGLVQSGQLISTNGIDPLLA